MRGVDERAGPLANREAQRHADVFLTYRTNAQLAIREVPALRIVALPAPLAVEAEYGLTVLNGSASARGEARRGEAFADHLLSPAGQAALERYGFSVP